MRSSPSSVYLPRLLGVSLPGSSPCGPDLLNLSRIPRSHSPVGPHLSGGHLGWPCPGNGLVGVNKFPKSKPIPGPKDQGFPHTREQQPKENKPNEKRVNPQPWSTTGRTTGPYQPGGGPRSLSPPRCRRSTQGFSDAHSRRDGTQNLEPDTTGQSLPRHPW